MKNGIWSDYVFSVILRISICYCLALAFFDCRSLLAEATAFLSLSLSLRLRLRLSLISPILVSKMYQFYLPLIFTLLVTHGHSQSGPYLFSGTGYLSNGQIGLLVDNAEAGIVLPALLAER